MTKPLDQSVRGHQPAGPKRWARARQWAEANPHSELARRYRERVAAAEALEAAAGDRAWQFWRRPHMWSGKKDFEYMKQVCSTRCMGLELQLVAGVNGVEGLHRMLTDPDPGRELWFRVLPRPAGDKRRGKCAVCGGAVT